MSQEQIKACPPSRVPEAEGLTTAPAEAAGSGWEAESILGHAGREAVSQPCLAFPCWFIIRG